MRQPSRKVQLESQVRYPDYRYVLGSLWHVGLHQTIREDVIS